MDTPLYLAIDQGTHASRAIVLDGRGGIVASGEKAIGLTRPQAGWAEQDPEEVVQSVRDAVTAAMKYVKRGAIAAAGLASQRASAICWDRRDGRALSPIFSWQDRRAHAWIDALQPAHGEAVHAKTGLFLSPHYGASKLRWALDHLPAVRGAAEAGTLAWGPMASFLAFRLLAERPLLADPQCAARTQLWNLHARDWDPELLALFGLPGGFLPRSFHTCGHWGTLDVNGKAVRLAAVNGDQSAAVFASGWPEADTAYLNIGTSAFVQRVLERFPGVVPRQLTGIILDDGTRTVYMVEGNVNGAGTALEWFARDFSVSDLLHDLPGWLDDVKTAPPLFLNGIAGLGGPFWKAEFESRFVGEGGVAEKAVALVESIAFLLQANVDHMAAHVPPPARIRLSGGLSRIQGLCRRIASVSGLPVHRRDDPEATARGIACLAAGRPAGWDPGGREDVFAPREDQALRARYREWRELMRQATGI